MTPEELKQVDDMFVVDNMRFEGLANNKLTPEKLKDFISSIIATREMEWKKKYGICEHDWMPCRGEICTSDVHTHHCKNCGKHAMQSIIQDNKQK